MIEKIMLYILFFHCFVNILAGIRSLYKIVSRVEHVILGYYSVNTNV